MTYKPVSADEEARHRETSAIAKRIALHEATILLDHEVKMIEQAHCGRAKGSVTVRGREIADAVKRCAEKVLALHTSVAIPERAAGQRYVRIDAHERCKLEIEVERLSPGIYPQLAGKADPPGCGSGRDRGEGGGRGTG